MNRTRQTGDITVDETDRKDSDVYLGVSAEALFALFPLVVVGIVLIYDERAAFIFKTPEWSFAAAVLSGQTLVKLLSGTASLSERTDYRFISLVGAIVFVFLLGPSIVTLTFIILNDHVSLIISGIQVIVLLLSLASFLFVGGIGQQWVDTGKV